MLNVPIKLLHDFVAMPTYATQDSAGLDISSAQNCTLTPSTWKKIPCGFAIALPKGYEGQIRPRSGLAFRHGISILNAPGTIDRDYRGEINVLLMNHGDKDFMITIGMRIAQLVIAPVSMVQLRPCTHLESTLRGAGGFGSTGI